MFPAGQAGGGMTPPGNSLSCPHPSRLPPSGPVPPMRLVLTLAALAAAPRVPAADPIPPGSGQFRAALGSTTLDVFTYKPAGYDPTAGPLVLVFHGVNRNADEYRDFAKPIADRTNGLVVAPRFPRDEFPNARYHRGGVLDGDAANPPEKWTFALVPKLAAVVREREGRPDMPYSLIGHSAGGQFLARLAGFSDSGAVRVVAANPGTDLFPTRDQDFPLGFGKLPADLGNDDKIRAYLARPLTLYLGTADNKPDEYFDKSPDSMRQGGSRYERGTNAFRAGEKLAKEKGWAFGWRLVEAPGVAHEAADMFAHPNCLRALDAKPAGGK
jgi:poly(3-hydroxybutyrate) depolymerase